MERRPKLPAASNRARCAILLLVLNAPAQIVLQAMLILETNKTYSTSQAICPSPPDVTDVTRFLSRTKQENLILMILHVVTLTILIIVLTSASSAFYLLLLVLFALSAASSFTQAFDGTLPTFLLSADETRYCEIHKPTAMARLEIARIVLSTTFLSAFIMFLVFMNSSLNPTRTPYKASIPSFLFFVAGTIFLALGDPDPLSWATLYLWIASASFALFIIIATLISPRPMRHNVRSQGIPKMPETKDLSSPGNSPLPQTFRSIPDVPPAQRDPLHADIPLIVRSTPTPDTVDEPRYHVVVPFSSLERESVLAEMARSPRSSVDVEAFNIAIRSRLAVETVPTVQSSSPTVSRGVSQRTTHSARTTSTGSAYSRESGSEASLLFDNGYITPAPNEGTPGAPSSERTENPPLPMSGNVQFATGPPRLSNSLSYPPPPPPRSSSGSMNTLTVPPYTYGTSSFLPHRNSILSNDGTYETLPSYHSQRSSPLRVRSGGLVVPPPAQPPSLSTRSSLASLPPARLSSDSSIAFPPPGLTVGEGWANSHNAGMTYSHNHSVFFEDLDEGVHPRLVQRR